MKKPEIGKEIASTGDGRDLRVSAQALQLPGDEILRLRGGGDLSIYEKVLSEPQVQSTLQQRILAVVQHEWKVDAGGDRAIDKAAAEHLKMQLHRIGWDRVTRLMLYGVYYGYAVAELIYGRDRQTITLDAIKVRNRKRFRYDREGQLRLLTANQRMEGVPCPPPYFWHYSVGADNDDEPYGLGLAHWLYWPVYFKRNGMKFWLIFLEKFGMPTAVGQYDADTATPEDRQKLLQATQAIQTDSGIILPKGMLIELLEAARSGTADYKSLHDTMDAAIAKVVLGQTASTQGTAGRLGNDELQADVRRDIIKADADLICESFNLGPARWLTEWNFPGAEIPRVYRVVEQPEDTAKRAEVDERVFTFSGYRPTMGYVQETYGVEVEKSPQPSAEFSESEPRLALADQAVLDELIGRLNPVLLQEQSNRLLQPLLDALTQGRDEDDLMALLAEAYPNMDDGLLTETLHHLLFVADTWGRLNAAPEVSTS